MPPRRPFKSRPLVRSHSTRELPAILVIVCEGGTEARLLTDLRGRWRIPAAEIVCIGDSGSPKTVVERALSERQDRKLANSDVEAWVVFDRDDHPSWREAIDRALTTGLRLAYSNPCFELWGILLHADQTAALHRRTAQSLLKRLHKGYCHKSNRYLKLDRVLDGIADAQRRAEGLLREAQRDDDEYRNPVTRFHELVAAIEKRRPDGT